MPRNFTPPTFDELIREAVEMTLRNGGHHPTIFAIGAKSVGLVVIADLPTDPDDKEMAMFAIGWELSRQPLGLLRDVVMITESWFRRAEPGEDVMRILPSQDPNRKEMLYCHHYAVRARHHEAVAFEMIRDREGRLSDLLAMIDTRTDSSGERPESHLIDTFMAGYHAGRKRRMPPPGGPRG